MIKLFLLYFIISSISHATIISGFVYDNKTNQPIPDVNIFIPSLNIGTASNEDGSFSLIIETKDDMHLFVSHIAYISKNMFINENLNEIMIKLDENFFISDDIVVTGTRNNKIYKNSPIAIEVISKRDIENSGALNVNDLLLTQSGISESPSVYGGYDIKIQGMDSKNILFLIDGQPITGKFYNRASLDQISINNVEKIEISKGPSSSLYGSSSMGGTINIITKPIINNKSINWSISHTFPMTENKEFSNGSNKYVLGIHNNHRENTTSLTLDNEKIFSKKIIKESDIDEINKNSVYLKSLWKINPNNKLKFNINHYLQKENGKTGLTNTSTKINRNNISINHMYSNQYKWKYNQLINYQNYSRSYVETRTNENVADDLSTEDSYEYEFFMNKKNATNEINLGMELSTINHQSNRLENEKYNLSAKSIFAQYSMNLLYEFNVILGLRLDKYSNYKIVYSPRIAVMKTLNRWKFRTSIGKGFRAPSFMEKFLIYNHATYGYKVQGNENLLPEKSFGGTMGLEYLHPNSYQISILLHHIRFIDHIMEIDLGEIDESNLNTYSYHNINNTYEGLEIRGKWKISSTTSASWEINFMDNKDNDGNSIPNSPPLTICNSYDYKSPTYPFGLTINTKWTQSYTPAYHNISNNSWTYADNKRSAFIIIDILGYYSINKFMKINLGCNNITNYTDDEFGPFTKKTLFLKLINEF